MQTLSIILILLVATRVCGAAAARLRQPVLVGELVAGIALGLLLGAFAGEVPILGHLSEDHHFMALTGADGHAFVAYADGTIDRLSGCDR